MSLQKIKLLEPAVLTRPAAAPGLVGPPVGPWQPCEAQQGGGQCGGSQQVETDG